MGVNLADLELGEITAGDFLIELRRIADALDRGRLCGERKDAAVCALADRHVGYHVTADGKVHWLDDD
jgi:hypothetical protein